MAVHRPARPGKAAARKSSHKRTPDALLRHLSAIIGGLLICATLAWFGWLVVRQHNPGLATIRFPFSGLQAQPTTQAAGDPLLAAGVTLSAPSQGQTALLSEPQALLLANQMEPQAAAHASKVSAQYVSFNYKGSGTTRASLHDVPAWLIHYTKVAEAGPDIAADPRATNPSHDCYLFLDANSGQELLALWT
ncbi:MAG TPA: hypothetical protein VGM01_11790 [Ktedonobacteraceae bacterium]|jgi:hypothetical protein